ncbi:MAG: helix-turn-helix domain-containing protein [Clostridia bacterium]|nr:helix-turn-helix domain-containing protein [Clostridia bacterium]
MEIASNFSETLSELMLIHNLTATKLAREINVDCTSFTKYFRKGVIPTLPYAVAIADYFCCSLDYLFGLANEYEKKEYLPCPPFFEKFQEALKIHNCTMYRLAKDLNFSYQIIIAWYHGRRIPAMGNIIILADYFGCTLDEFVGRK